jgi:hypothetical protein
MDANNPVLLKLKMSIAAALRNPKYSQYKIQLYALSKLNNLHTLLDKFHAITEQNEPVLEIKGAPKYLFKGKIYPSVKAIYEEITNENCKNIIETYTPGSECDGPPQPKKQTRRKNPDCKTLSPKRR